MEINFKKIHFIGIGGIGMSALARLFKSRSLEVSG
jgi:UDP-N-acetylmuramate-alanine ligase